MKILHLAPDDKFIPFFQKVFEAVYPEQNMFRIYKPGGESKVNYSELIGDTLAINDEYWNSNKFKKEINECDYLIVNFMFHSFAKAINNAPKHVVIIWVSWGADYYEFLKHQFGGFILNETNAIVNKIQNKFSPIKNPLRLIKKLFYEPHKIINYFKSRFFVRKRKATSGLELAIDRIDYFSIYEEEIPYFNKSFPNHRMQFHRLQLYSAEDTFEPGGDIYGDDILVGNSATPTNNHVEILMALQKIDLGNRKIICPLNYGNPDYGDEIEKIGAQYFGKRFIALRQFKPFSEYNEYMARCGNIFMNHVRQQGATTIATSLYKGGVVYLRKENPMYTFYKRMGLSVYPISSIDIDSLKKNRIQAYQNVELSKKKLIDYWGREVAIRSVEKIKELRRAHIDSAEKERI